MKRFLKALLVVVLFLLLIFTTLYVCRDEIAELVRSVTGDELVLAAEDLTVHAEELEKILLDERYKDIGQELSFNSLSPKDGERTRACGFSDALTFPFEATEPAEMLGELKEEVLLNPVYGITVARALSQLTVGDKTMVEINPWLECLTDPKPEPDKEEGLVRWLEYRPGEGKTMFLTTEYRTLASCVCTLLERLVPVGVEAHPNTANWSLNYTAANNDRMGVLSGYTYSLDALMLVYRLKNGGELFRIGFNIHDKRPELYGEEIVETEAPTEPETEPPTEAPTEPPTEAPTEPPTEPETEPPTEPPTYPEKDPELASYEYVEPNDDPGPGPDTNAGEGAVYSPEDQDTNSNHMSDYEEYVEVIEELEIINESQKTGDDDNTPSYTPPVEYVTNPAEPEAEPETLPPPVIDNNGDTGNTAVEAVVVNEAGEEEIVEIGTAAPIDEPTPIQPPATIVGGEAISTEPAGEWGGPPD